MGFWGFGNGKERDATTTEQKRWPTGRRIPYSTQNPKTPKPQSPLYPWCRKASSRVQMDLLFKHILTLELHGDVLNPHLL